MNKTRIIVGLASLALSVVTLVATHTNDSPWDSPHTVRATGVIVPVPTPSVTATTVTNDSPWD